MFQVDLTKNRIQKLYSARFSELKLREREHLQEWLANQPDALGEELLIIQKEFDGFADTRERLDLLAIDQEGQLVIIENKLDDSGRDVAWQALKYAAYVSSLTKSQILVIYQQYLDRYCGGGNANERMCEFLDVDSLDGVVLNEGHAQRLMFIAAHFRKEVTSTVLWLREHDIDARCLRVTPYQHGDSLFVDIQQVIPTPEAAEFMIQMTAKETEEKATKGHKRWSHEMRLAFWADLLEDFRKRGNTRWLSNSPRKDRSITSSIDVPGVSLKLSFLRHEIRVEIHFDFGDRDLNQAFMEKLKDQTDINPNDFAEPLEWQYPEKRNAGVLLVKKAVQGYSKENWPDMIAWLADNHSKFETFFTPNIQKISAEMRKKSLETE
ncbi:hypothetical protein BVC71_09465 [Marivivens niveibacter]|uniref:DUF4268 domain-containing protein n=1 Tax=Marivivens niveibacter TaxID=1930667 RepID=A0A251WX65_9RHOB|nr:DUF4268 domain-containing protein [Marivivens niveibacter]OUD08936.1 hypothetical protein BVC71_09465 [Marivivens niveibacter]